MKKLFFLSAVCGLAVAASAVEVFSCNTVGVQRVSANVSEVTVGVPFTAIGGGDATLQSLIFMDDLATGDVIQTCLNSTYGYYNVWTTINLPDLDFTQYVPNNRTYNRRDSKVSVATPAASDYFLPRGSAVKITRGDTQRAVYVMGEYSDAGITSTVAGSSTSYFVNTTQAPLDIETVFADNIGDWDEIHIVNGNSEYVYYWDWYGEEVGNEMRYWYRQTQQLLNGKTKITYHYDAPTIESGAAFFYVREDNTDLTFTW